MFIFVKTHLWLQAVLKFMPEKHTLIVNDARQAMHEWASDQLELLHITHNSLQIML